jgi:hypothetical protein
MWITPSLRVTGAGLLPAKAYDVIKAGYNAEVETLDDAREVMAMLGMTQEQIDDRIHFAMTGEVLHAI